jgi:hypothetical protein
MTLILSNLVLVVAVLVGAAGLVLVFRSLSFLRHAARRTAPPAFSMLLLAALLFSACEKEKVDTDDVPVLDQAVLVGDTLRLTGTFGTAPGAVLVNGTELPAEDIVTWRNTEIVCIKKPPIPDQIVVEVIVDGRKSQPRVITVNSDFRITYLLMNEDEWKLYIFGNFGPDPGPGQRQVKVNNVVLGADNITEVEVWSPKLITCIIPSTGPASSGEVVVSRGASLSASRILNQWRDTIFYDRPQHGNSGTLGERVWFDMTFRGDTGPIPPEAQDIVSWTHYNFHDVANATYEAQGTAHCSYTQDGCASVFVSWAYTTDWLAVTPNGVDDAGESSFHGYIHPVPGGFDVEIFFEAWQVTPATIETQPCNGDAFTTTRMESIQFDAFEGETIELRFDGKNIRAGELKEENLGSNGALTWDFIDVGNHFVTATLSWPTMVAKH